MKDAVEKIVAVGRQCPVNMRLLPAVMTVRSRESGTAIQTGAVRDSGPFTMIGFNSAPDDRPCQRVTCRFQFDWHFPSPLADVSTKWIE